MDIRLPKKIKANLISGGSATGAFAGLAAGGASSAGFVGAAVGLAGIGLVGLVIAGFAWFSKEDFGRLERPAVRDATADDLDRFHSRLSEFTPHVVPLTERHEISRKNSGCFRVIEDLREQGTLRKLIDIVAVYPLNRDALDLVLSGKMRGSQVRANHVCRKMSDAVGLYISFAEGHTFTSRGLIVREIERIVENTRIRPVTIVTIPTTEQALTLVTNKGLLKLDGNLPELGVVCAGII